MPRPHDTERYELSDAEKRDLIKLIETGRPLPEKYRFLLFEDKREVCTAILPFQSLEHIDEPRKEKSDEDELGLGMGGRQVKGWTNKLIWGDNKLILSSLKAGALRRQIEEAGGLKLIYIDPPFDVGADFSMDIEIGGETFHKEPNLLEQIAYRDTWGRGADSFIAMIYERLILMRDLMHKDGSIYVHCDWRVNSHIRLAMAEVFGGKNFRNEIIRIKCNPKNYTTSSFGNIHDSIFFFTKSEETKLNRIFDERDDDQLAADFPLVEERTGRSYTTGALHAKGIRSGITGEPWRGIMPPAGRHWAYVSKTLDEMDAKGLIEWSSNGNPRGKRYADEDTGKVVQTIWEFKDPGDRSADYATQKPEALLERIISASSNPGDLVADFFCGSGTTAAVAEKLGRKWIATDLGKFGIHTTRKRLIQVQRDLKAGGKPFRAFEVLNLGRYERQAYLNISGRLTGKKKADALAKKEQEFRELILRAYKAQPLDNEPFFHGKNAGRLVVVGPINLPVGRLFVEEVITECRKGNASRVDVLAFEFEMGLFPAVLDEAKKKGIDIFGNDTMTLIPITVG